MNTVWSAREEFIGSCVQMWVSFSSDQVLKELLIFLILEVKICSVVKPCLNFILKKKLSSYIPLMVTLEDFAFLTNDVHVHPFYAKTLFT